MLFFECELAGEVDSGDVTGLHVSRNLDVQCVLYFTFGLLVTLCLADPYARITLASLFNFI
jgi:hypothetical protein